MGFPSISLFLRWLKRHRVLKLGRSNPQIINFLAAFTRGKGAVYIRLDVLPHPLNHPLAPELRKHLLNLGPRTLAVRIDRIHAAAGLPISAPRNSQPVNQRDTGCCIVRPCGEARTGAEEEMTVTSFYQWNMHQRTKDGPDSLQHAHQPTDRAARDARLDSAGEVVHERNLGRHPVMVRLQGQRRDGGLVAIALHPAEIPALEVGQLDRTFLSGAEYSDDAA